MNNNFHLCIHAHFYQPPRENPWIEAIEYQDSARPYHDWNERISAECYRPNGLSRILDEKAWVVRLTNNYSRISFNFGPTLLSWMEENDPTAYAAILEGDRKSRDRFGGHGSAIAQAYNHMIMPLANRRDRETQVKWGLRDFESRFGREAEAMWLPETAVDLETLQILAGHGMKYAILAPRQAHSVKTIDAHGPWKNVEGERVDPKQPYWVELPGGQGITVFFYDGPISKAVAFERLLNNGETFANRLMTGFDPTSSQTQLVHIATDGESYGHHHRHGDMALAYALDVIEQNQMAAITNYGAYLKKFPAQLEAQIHENSSWSCFHGIERWRSDCGCNSGGNPGWHQKWRAPLREAMDVLRNSIAAPYAAFMGKYTGDPDGMRDDYINIILDRSQAAHDAFFSRWLRDPSVLDQPGIDQILLKAMEMQRNLLLMYTSCAWFFDEISGIESVQTLQYAARAMELARDVLNIDVEDDFTAILLAAPSNIPAIGNGSVAYDRFARPARVDAIKVATHLAALALFQDRLRNGALYCFDYRWIHTQRAYSGKAQLICATVEIVSRITHEINQIELAVVHLGDHNINVGALPYGGEESYNAMVADFMNGFGRGDLAKSVRLLDKYFESNLYSLNDLFRDQQKEIIDIVFSQTLAGVEDQFINIYEQHYPVMSYLSDIHAPLPGVFLQIARFVQNNMIKKELDRGEPNYDEIARYLGEAGNWGVKLDESSLSRHFIAALKKKFAMCEAEPDDIEALRQFAELLSLTGVFPFTVDLGEIQNNFSIWAHDGHHHHSDDRAEWESLVNTIADTLRVRINYDKHYDIQ